MPRKDQIPCTELNVLIDTTAVPSDHAVPDSWDQSVEGYYSVCQLIPLHYICRAMSVTVSLDSYLHEQSGQFTWNEEVCNLNIHRAHTERSATRLRSEHSLRAIALLCQHVSNRYYPIALGNSRTFSITPSTQADDFVVFGDRHWSWKSELSDWDPSEVEDLYRLSPKKLRDAHRLLSILQARIDPLSEWYQLVQFVAESRRKQLRGDALKAKTIREGALMLGYLYRDLYGETLKQPNEVTRTIFRHIPELDTREDPRHYLELVTNRFELNPKVKLCLFVEGTAEHDVIHEIFQNYFNFHPGAIGVEIIVLKGVDHATGGKFEKYSGMVRIIDYLHDHHTHTFLLLDNENSASKVRDNLLNRVSIHFDGRYVTKEEWIEIWDHSFEFDNYSLDEIQDALHEVVDNQVTFNIEQLSRVKDSPKNKSLNKLFRDQMGDALPKRELNRILVRRMFHPKALVRIERRPIIKILNRLTHLAKRHHLPITYSEWQCYQRLGFGSYNRSEIGRDED